MNVILEQKLKELIEEAEQLGAPAVHTVLNLLLAAHNNGNHHKFAKHCCEFLSLGNVMVTAQSAGNTHHQTSSDWGGLGDNSWGKDLSKSSH